MEIDGINEEVFVQYEIIRRSGMTNMFDKNTVHKIAIDVDLVDLVSFIEEDDKNYMKILKNFGKAKEAGIV